MYTLLRNSKQWWKMQQYRICKKSYKSEEERKASSQCLLKIYKTNTHDYDYNLDFLLLCIKYINIRGPSSCKSPENISHSDLFFTQRHSFFTFYLLFNFVHSKIFIYFLFFIFFAFFAWNALILYIGWLFVIFFAKLFFKAIKVFLILIWLWHLCCIVITTIYLIRLFIHLMSK